ncbi:hypothetical protein BHM03_00032815 [Ensete ventricosum]|nr:hypothetical protein BHM03_00032815 [Ensete ventricosum]
MPVWTRSGQMLAVTDWMLDRGALHAPLHATTLNAVTDQIRPDVALRDKKHRSRSPLIIAITTRSMAA